MSTLEMAGFGHPFLDGAYPLIGHFNCMDCLQFPPEVTAGRLHAYRSELAVAYPELTADDQFGANMASACAVWLASMLRTLPDALTRDRVISFHQARSRQRLLAVLDTFVTAATTFGQMPGLIAMCQQIRDMHNVRWADTVEPSPYFYASSLLSFHGMTNPAAIRKRAAPAAAQAVPSSRQGAAHFKVCGPPSWHSPATGRPPCSSAMASQRQYCWPSTLYLGHDHTRVSDI